MEVISETAKIAGVEILKSDWEATPASVKALVIALSDRIIYVEEQLKQTSQNSSRPPSGVAQQRRTPSEPQYGVRTNGSPLRHQAIAQRCQPDAPTSE
ncbi:hypothetical protein HC928_06840 [bacterium]|nr:hypothetical protein [bacterium]